uniref:hypothetical protein n=2 Tax=Campylobacter sp. MG1 TaxID=2976332 RepID=UPI00226CF72E
KPVDVVTPVEPKPEPTPVEPEDKPVDNSTNGMKVTILVGDESGSFNNQTPVEPGTKTEDRTPTFVGEFDAKGAQSVVITIVEPNGKMTQDSFISIDGKFTYTPTLPCNEFGNYEYHFAVVGNTNVSASTNLVYADLSGNVVDNNMKIEFFENNGAFGSILNIEAKATDDLSPIVKGEFNGKGHQIVNIEIKTPTGFVSAHVEAIDGKFTYKPVFGCGNFGNYDFSFEVVGQEHINAKETLAISLYVPSTSAELDNKPADTVVVPEDKPVDNSTNGMKVTILVGDESGSFNNQTPVEPGTKTEDRTPTFVGEFDAKGAQSVVITIVEPNGKMTQDSFISIDGKFTYTPTLPCNEFGNYEYHFAVVGNTNVSASTNLVYADLSGNNLISDDSGFNLSFDNVVSNQVANTTTIDANDVLDTTKDVFGKTETKSYEVQEGYINLDLSKNYSLADKNLHNMDDFNNINNHS